MEKKTWSFFLSIPVWLKKSRSFSKESRERVVGINGINRISAAAKIFSESRVMFGGQSRKYFHILLFGFSIAAIPFSLFLTWEAIPNGSKISL